jgi:predicted transcriptional regulator
MEGKMIKHLKLYDVKICKTNDTVLEIAKIFKNEHVRHIYVVDNEDKPIGIISTIDIVEKVIAEKKESNNTLAKDIMNSPVDFVDLNQEAEYAMKIMMQRKTYSCLVTENGKIKGIVDYKSVVDEIIKRMKEE